MHVAATLQRISTFAATIATHASHRPWLVDLLKAYGLNDEWLAALPALEWEGIRPSDPISAQRTIEEEIIALMRPPSDDDAANVGCGTSQPRFVAFNLFALEAWHVAEAFGLPAIALAPYPMPHRPPRVLFEWLGEEHPELCTALKCAGHCEPPAVKEVLSATAAANADRDYPSSSEQLFRSSGPCWCTLTHWQYPLFNEGRWAPLRQKLGLPPLPCSTPELRQRPTARTPLLYGFSALTLPPSPPSKDGSSAAAAGTLPHEAWFPLDRFCDHAKASVSIPGHWMEPAFLTNGQSNALITANASKAIKTIAITFGSMLSLGAIRGAGELSSVLSTISRACRAAGVKGIVIVPSGLTADVTSLSIEGREVPVYSDRSVIASGRKDIGASNQSTSDADCTTTPLLDKPLQPPAAAGESISFGADESLEHWVPYATWLGEREKSSASSVPLFLYSGSVPFHWLFPRVTAVLHHGGSGTTAAALHAGVPQVIAPVIFDQHTWAAATTSLGVAPEPLPFWGLFDQGSRFEGEEGENDVEGAAEGTGEELSAHAVASALRLAAALQEAVTSPSLRHSACELAAKLRGEDGCARAADAILKHLKSCS